jgi:hypothetical protein
MYLLCTLLWMAAAEPALPVAMVLDVAGKATLQRSDGPAQVLQTMDLLRPGDRLKVADGAVRLVLLNDGHGERLPAKAEVTVGDQGCQPAEAVERLPRKLSAAQLKRLRGLAQSNRAGVGVLRSPESDAVPAVTPLFGSMVVSERPTLTWPAVSGATGYEVRLVSGQGKEERLEWKATTTESRLRYPDGQPPLPAGVVRYWEVRAQLPGGKEQVAVRSKFNLATETERASLRKLERLVDSSDAADWLLAAASYEAYFAYDEALRLYEKLAQRHPEAAHVHTALASYYARAGQKEKSEASRQRAKQLQGTGAKD